MKGSLGPLVFSAHDARLLTPRFGAGKRTDGQEGVERSGPRFLPRRLRSVTNGTGRAVGWGAVDVIIDPGRGAWLQSRLGDLRHPDHLVLSGYPAAVRVLHEPALVRDGGRHSEDPFDRRMAPRRPLSFIFTEIRPRAVGSP